MDSEKLLFRLEQPHGQGNVYISWQRGSSNYLATTGTDCMVNIFNRYGKIQERIKLPSLCTGFEWNSRGNLLGIVSETSKFILWDSNLQKKHTIDLNLTDTMTALFWTKNNEIVAIGSAKGNVYLYDHETSKHTPIIGKHSKKITCGGWNTENILVLGSEDKTLSLSNIEGDTIKIIALRAEPSEIQFSEMKVDERIGGENTISLIVGKRTLYLYNIFDPENPIELAFQKHYGSLVTYRWFGDGYILLGFSLGHFIAISSHIKEVGQELFQIKNHKNSLSDIALCKQNGKVASCGDNVIKIHEISNLQETSSILSLPHESGLERIRWSEEGQLLAVCTINGSINVYVLNIPMLTAVSGTKILILSNLSEVNLYDFYGNEMKMVPVAILLEVEPSLIAIGPYHLAAGLNDKVWFYDLTKFQPNSDNIPMLLKIRPYTNTVVSVKINQEFVSVLLSDGTLELHMIEQPESEYQDRETKLFPDSNFESKITCHEITTDFLIYGTDNGYLIYFHVEEWGQSNTFKHSNGITKIISDPSGTRIILIDSKNHGYVYTVATGELIDIPDFPLNTSGAVWDSCLTDKNIFFIFNEGKIFPYFFRKYSIYGTSLQKIDDTNITFLANEVPLFMYSGLVLLARPNGLITTLNLDFSADLIPDDDVYRKINRTISYHKYKLAHKYCCKLDSKEMLLKLAEESLKNVEVYSALMAYKKLRNIAMVSSLKKILNVEDTKLLAGYCSMFLRDYNNAQKCFMNSQCPQMALEMQSDLHQWDKALEIAKKIAPSEVPFISKEYAHELELFGNNKEAYVLYENGLGKNSDNISKKHIFLCKCGQARTAIRYCNYKQGMMIANEVNDKNLFTECAEILSSMGQFSEAAAFYEKAQVFDKAVLSYIKIKNWKKVEQLLPNVTTSNVHLQYAKATESLGNYEKAVKAYYLAKDFDSVIRLELDFLNNPSAAIELAQQINSIEGFKMIATYFQRVNDFTSALKYLVLSNAFEEANELAKKHNMYTFYGDILLNSLPGENVRLEDFNTLAVNFEKERNYLLAGKFYFHAKEFEKALDNLLKAAKSVASENEAISFAIDVVASANDKKLASSLVEFLLGEIDEIPKDPKYLFRLYMAQKQFKDAAKSAMIIANEEQINGNYRNARDILFNMYRELKSNEIEVSYDMYYSLMLLHSYILVRLHVKRGDHLTSARLLIRVAENISKFPSHIVPILTSTVIECQRAELKQAAHKYAKVLIQNPKYRKEIDTKYEKKIESIVRKAPKSGILNGGIAQDPIEPVSPCPYCKSLISDSETVCSSCKNNVPICIVTGRHVINDDLTVCHNCNFPAIRSKFLEMLNSKDENKCPMCQATIDPMKLEKISQFIKI